MTPEMLEQAVRAFARRRPFRAFWVEFVSGERVLITHPEAIARFGNLFLYRGPDRAQRLFAAPAICQLIEYLGDSASG